MPLARRIPPGTRQPGGEPRRIRGTTARRRLAADRFGRWLVAAGGVGIIATILGILLFILIEVWPLFGGARVEPLAGVRDARLDPAALVIDEYRTHAVSLDRDGRVRIVDLERGVVDDELPLAGDVGAPDGPPTALAPVSGRPVVAGGFADGRVVVRTVSFAISFDDTGRRLVAPEVSAPTVLAAPGTEGRTVVRLAVAASPAGDELAVAAAWADGTLHVFHTTREENDFTGEVETSVEDRPLEPLAGGPPAALAVSARGERVLAATADGRLALYEAGDPRPSSVSGPGAPVTALTWLVGDRAAVVGRKDGAIEVWFPIRDRGETRSRIVFVRAFPPRDAPIAVLAPSLRNKGFVALDRGGGAGLYHSTSRRTLWRGEAGEAARTLVLAPRADGLLVGGSGQLALWRVDNPHPEISLGTLFGKVWYEGYPGPAWVWQSTGGTDDAEPKLSLVPLLVGTLKGTFYSLILAIPIGVLGAMYASQFMHPRLRNAVKPVVEIMAALPSVVLGFLAGLWLAPLIQRVFPGLLLTLVLVPLAVIAAGAVWHRLPARLRHRVPDGLEVVAFAAAIVAAMWLSFELSPWVESMVFGGSFPDWIHAVSGIPYDQRNAVIVGIAMGFAVIPIIFSVAEDAFSNVPRTLISGSLALGASRWQTVTRIVLPTASPGIFSAVMIGFGRAIGETMIVLMATGNTPIMSWFPFNGFRTLSANIAVEIPEAPYGGTLYRTLFFSALLLFALTFVINTVAEVVRQRLRGRYADL
ncbi:MAG: ABC transporter permease subunit [Acidobacteria bacterium]|nr:MAG: ABC transporter permease subunit [Acidobacteriota bacterium]